MNYYSRDLERRTHFTVKLGLLNDCKTSAYLYMERRPLIIFEFEKR